MTPHRDITEEEWLRVMPLLPELQPRSELRGRPLANTRSVLNGVLWVMYSGATWSAMPRRYPSYQTCHRRFKVWYDEGVLKRVMAELFNEKGVALCDSIEARMRKHPVRVEKGMLDEQQSVSLPTSQRFGVVSPAVNPSVKPSVTPPVPQPFSYSRTLFHQTA